MVQSGMHQPLTERLSLPSAILQAATPSALLATQRGRQRFELGPDLIKSVGTHTAASPSPPFLFPTSSLLRIFHHSILQIFIPKLDTSLPQFPQRLSPGCGAVLGTSLPSRRRSRVLCLQPHNQFKCPCKTAMVHAASSYIKKLCTLPEAGGAAPCAQCQSQGGKKSRRESAARAPRFVCQRSSSEDRRQR